MDRSRDSIPKGGLIMNEPIIEELEDSLLDPDAIAAYKKKQILEKALEEEPTIEELSYLEALKDLENNKPQLIVLKPRMELKRCLSCGYTRPMWIIQQMCPNFRCKRKTLEVLDVEEFNENLINEWKMEMENLPNILKWKKE